jgi:putative RecB family exonuclease
MGMYSHSKLSTFEDCKYRYKLCYVDKIRFPRKKAAHLVLGTVVHNTLEKLYKDLGYQKTDSLKAILDYFDKEWEKEWTQEVINPKKEEGITENHFKAMGKKYIEDYYAHYQPFDQMKIIGLETTDKLKLKDGSYYDIRIDKLGCNEETYYVCDYKTDSRLKEQSTADEDRQLAMYSLWVKKKFHDAKKIVLMWHMLKFDKEVTSERKLKDLDKLETQVTKLIKQIEKTTEYPTNVTGRCIFCEYKALCPNFKHEIEIEELPTKKFKENDGVKLVDKYQELTTQKKETETQLEDIKTDLIAFATQQEIERIYGSNKTISVKEYQKIVYKNKEKLEEKLKKLGKFEELSMISYPRLNSLVNKGEIKLGKLVEKIKDYRLTMSNKKE